MKPILFNTEMVRAIMDDRKTVTRRVVKPGHLRVLDSPYHKEHPETPDQVLLKKLCLPPYLLGDFLYVRETWAKNANGGWFYRADNKNEVFSWRPSIHMPKEAARLFLRIKDARVERLHDMTTADMVNEGMDAQDAIHSPWKWHELWDSTIKPADRAIYGWDANPWVWVIEFERVTREEAENG